MFNRFVKARNNRKGFTLIEVMIVVAIVAILAAAAVPAYLSYKKEAKREVARVSLVAVIDSLNGHIILKNDNLGMVDSNGNVTGKIKDVIDKLASDENQENVTVDGIKTDAPLATYCSYNADSDRFEIRSDVKDEQWEALHDDGTPYTDPVE